VGGAAGAAATAEGALAITEGALAVADGTGGDGDEREQALSKSVSARQRRTGSRRRRPELTVAPE